MKLIRTLETNPAFNELRRLLENRHTEFYSALARKLYAKPSEVDQLYLEREQRYWQGVKWALLVPAETNTTRGDRS